MTKQYEPAVDWELLESAMLNRRGDSQQAIANQVVAIGATLLRKNRDYGSSIWKAPLLAPDLDPSSAIRVRMSDKIERLIMLLASSKSEVDESIDDTLRDLAGYCLLELARPKNVTPRSYDGPREEQKSIKIEWLKSIGFCSDKLFSEDDSWVMVHHTGKVLRLAKTNPVWFAEIPTDFQSVVIEQLHNPQDVISFLAGEGRFKSRRTLKNKPDEEQNESVLDFIQRIKRELPGGYELCFEVDKDNPVGVSLFDNEGDEVKFRSGFGFFEDTSSAITRAQHHAGLLNP